MVLLDLLMPGVVGQEVLEYLDAAGGDQVPVAIVSASPQLATPGVPLFTKPIDLDRLLEFVRRQCQKPAPEVTLPT